MAQVNDVSENLLPTQTNPMIVEVTVDGSSLPPLATIATEVGPSQIVDDSVTQCQNRPPVKTPAEIKRHKLAAQTIITPENVSDRNAAATFETPGCERPGKKEGKTIWRTIWTESENNTFC